MAAKLREMEGSPKQMATALGLAAESASFRRALRELTEQGILVAVGSTRDRTYRNTLRGNAKPPVQPGPDVQAKLLALVLAEKPCSARHFSDEAHKLGLEGKALGDLKLRLGIESYKADNGRWYCRYVEGYRGPAGPTPREGAGLTASSGYTDSMAFAPLAARAAKDHPTIGKGKASKGDD